MARLVSGGPHTLEGGDHTITTETDSLQQHPTQEQLETEAAVNELATGEAADSVHGGEHFKRDTSE